MKRDPVRIAVIGVGVIGMGAWLALSTTRRGSESKPPAAAAKTTTVRDHTPSLALGDDGEPVVEAAGSAGAGGAAGEGGAADDSGAAVKPRPASPYELQVESVALPRAADPAAIANARAVAVGRGDPLPDDVRAAAAAAAGRPVTFAIGGDASGGGLATSSGTDTGANPGGPPVPGTTSANPKPPPGDGALADGATYGAGLPKEIVRRMIRRHLGEITACYDDALARHPGIEGTVTAAFTIERDGSVSGATASGVHPEVSACIAGVIGGVRFPRPDGTAVVNVRYPFVFRSP